MAASYKLQDYDQINGKDVFVDANVLIYLFWPTGQYWLEESYALAFRNLLRQGNRLFVDYLVLSEVVNRIGRIEFKKVNSQLNYKDFRDSPIGKEVTNDIFIIVKDQILSSFNVIGKSFNKQDIEQFLIVDELDFVDKATASICKENNMVLLTNDRDFKNSDLVIYTGNRHIIN